VSEKKVHVVANPLCLELVVAARQTGEKLYQLTVGDNG
jgi:hypothetical protein